MGPITRLTIIGIACIALILGATGVRSCYSRVFGSAGNHVAFTVTSASSHDEYLELANPISALSALTDFRKLATLNATDRSINIRLKKILYWLNAAEKNGIQPYKAMSEAFESNGNTASKKASLVKAQTVLNYQIAKSWGIFSVEGLPKLKRGEAVQILVGTYFGQFIEIDHIVPIARYPQFANDLANLQLLPQSQNRAKSDKMGPLEFEKLNELQNLY